MKALTKKIVPILLVLSMIFTTGIQSVNFADNVEEGTKEQAEMTSLEEVKEEIEKGDPSLKLEVSLRDKPYKNGDTVEYEIRLKNDGEVDLENIKVKEDLNKEFLIKELKVKEEKLTNRKYKIDENNKLDEIKNKVEIEVNFDGKSLNYEGQFKLAVVKEEPKEEVKEEPKEEPKQEEKEEPKQEEAKQEEKKEETKEETKEEENIKEETETDEELEEEQEEEEKEIKSNLAEDIRSTRHLKFPVPVVRRNFLMSNGGSEGFVAVNKTANRYKELLDSCRTFKVDLEITGQPPAVPVDVVLILDKSGSMNEKTPITSAPVANDGNKYFVKTGSSYSDYVEVVHYSGNTWRYGSRYVYWNPNGSDTASGNTSSWNPTGKPFYFEESRMEAAKKASNNFAGKVLNDAPAGSRVSVVEFSGPTTTSGNGAQNQAQTSVPLTNNITTINSAINNIVAVGGTNTQAGFKQGRTVIENSGNPNSKKVVIMFTDGLPTASNGRQYAETTDINHLHIQSAITAGKGIFNDNVADVFTVGLLQGMSSAERTLALNILGQTNNSGFYEAPTAADLDQIFADIAEEINYFGKNAVVVDKIGDNFNLIESSLPQGATYNSSTREITWTIGQMGSKKTLSYILQAKQGFEGGLADTNEYATLTYIDPFDIGKTKDFPKPKVNVPTLIEISLTDATIVSGDSISLGTGTDPLGENYMSPVTGGDNDGINFTYEWRKVGDSTVISTDKNPSVSPTEDTNYEVTVTDSNGCKARATMWVRVTKKFDFGIKKIADKDTHEELLDGAKFVLKDEDELEVKSGITVDGYLWMNDLLPGTYTLQETEAPVGYKLNSQVYTITIAANGDISVDPNLAIVTEDGKKVLVIENDLLEFNIRLKKVDKESRTLLNGAEFELKKDGVVIPTAATVGGYIDLNNLLAGAYTLQETVAPIGYELNSQVYTITIAANGDITIDPELEIVTENDKKVIVVKNDLLEFDIGLKKIDKKTGALLDGAKFKWTKDGVETELNVVDGYIDIDNLLAGTYTLEETKAPDGYKLDKTKYSVTISATGQVTVDPELTIETVEGRQVIVVENSEKGVFPSTGGPGTMIFIILGIGLMLISLVGYRNGGLKMKKNKKFLSLLMALVMVLAVASPILAVGETGSLKIHKLYFPDQMGETIDGTGEVQTSPAGTVPLAGAKFTIWKVADNAEMPYTPSGTGTEVTTDANGLAEFPNLAYGRYYVEETFLPKGVTTGSEPFMVDIPTTSVDGTRLIDDVHVYPKNVLTLGAARLHKMDEEEEGLAGAKFSLYKKGNPDELIASGIVTGSDGWTEIQGNLEVGDYYFIETEAPNGYLLDETKKEFTIAAGDHAYADGEIITGKVKEVHLTNSEKPGQPEKEADKDDAGIGDKVTWTIKTQLPGNIDTYDVYKITDKLDQALNYNGNVAVTLAGAPLTAGNHYDLTAPAVGSNGTLEFNFIPSTLSAGELVITFDTIVNKEAVAGTDIENKAILDYNNGFEVGQEETPIVNVKVGGHKFIKTNQKQEGLQGAEFIVRRATDGQYLVKTNGMISWGAKANAFKFVSDIDGKFAVEGVAFGNYFLEETKAPTGYAKLQNPVEFTVSENTHTTELPIVNKTKPGMPQTGGMGTLAFTAIGLAFMGLAAKTYKKEEK